MRIIRPICDARRANVSVISSSTGVVKTLLARKAAVLGLSDGAKRRIEIGREKAEAVNDNIWGKGFNNVGTDNEMLGRYAVGGSHLRIQTAFQPAMEFIRRIILPDTHYEDLEFSCGY